jgi:hypothetical protein
MSSTLKERLDRIRAQFEGTAPEDAKAIMHRATEDLRNSETMRRIPSAGDPLSAFELPDTAVDPVRSEDLLEQGPLVVTFYRGVW